MTTDNCKGLNYKNRISLQSIPATIYKNRARSWEKFYHLHSLVNKVCYSYCTVCFKIWGTSWEKQKEPIPFLLLFIPFRWNIWKYSISWLSSTFKRRQRVSAAGAGSVPSHTLWFTLKHCRRTHQALPVLWDLILITFHLMGQEHIYENQTQVPWAWTSFCLLSHPNSFRTTFSFRPRKVTFLQISIIALSSEEFCHWIHSSRLL